MTYSKKSARKKVAAKKTTKRNVFSIAAKNKSYKAAKKRAELAMKKASMLFKAAVKKAKKIKK